LAVAQKGESRGRTQVVTPRSKRRAHARPRKTSAINVGEIFKYAATFAKPAAALVGVVLLIVGYNALAGSGLFELRRVEINTVETGLRAEVEQMVRRGVGSSKLLDIDLASIKQRLELIGQVREVTVARVLPDTISVQIAERRPAVLVRRKTAIVWLDEEGVELGETSDVTAGKNAEIPPIAKGFSEGGRTAATIAEDRERITLYKQIESELGAEPNPVWDLIDEIDLAYPKNVNMRLANPPVTVVVGSKDFRNRFDTALKVLGAIRRGDGELLSRFRVQDPERLIQNADNIDFIDTSRADRIVLNFSTPMTEKSAPQEKQPSNAPGEKKATRQETKPKQLQKK
jgi:POTRA domain-containing FtsQ-type protein